MSPPSLIYIPGSGSSCPSYTPGLYTAEEIDNLVFVDGYIPVSTVSEFKSMCNGLPNQIMGVGTCWEGSYTNSANGKYLLINSLDFTSVTWGSSEVIQPSSSLYGYTLDGNNFALANINGTRAFFGGFGSKDISVKNIALIDNYTNKAGNNNSILIEDLRSGNLDNISISGCEVEDGTYNGLLVGTCYTNEGDINVNNITISATNTMDAGAIMGSLIGRTESNANYTVNVSNVTNNTSISTASGTQIGGLIGNARNVTISNCNQYGNVSSARLSGLIVGYAENDCIIEDCLVQSCSITSSNTSDGRIAGIAGYVPGDNVIIRRCEINDVTVTSIGNKAGGIFGESFNASLKIHECAIINCVIEVTGSGRDYAGGIGGWDRNVAIDIDDCYVDVNTSIIVDGSYAGGIMGRIVVAGSTVDNCYSCASVSGSSSIGGLVGANSGTWTNCYWNTDTGPASSAAGIGKTTLELQTPTTNSGIYSAWDDTIWDFGTASDYPELTTTP
jgi:hypothetical protein